MKRQWTMMMIAGLGLCSGCGVETAGRDTGGVDLGDGGGVAGDGGVYRSPSPRGFSVFNSDFESSSVSLLGLDGEVLSESFISTASSSSGLSAPLSGDVVPSTQPARAGELVLVDRFPAGVLTWVDLETAEVRAQLSVGTGFSANPHDYVEVSPTRAYVPRFERNLEPGAEPFDRGGDVLVVDPTVPEIVGSIPLDPVLDGVEPGIHARGDRALIAGGLPRIVVVALDDGFERTASARIVTIDPKADAITHTLVVEGLRNCTSLTLSPDGTRLAAACNGAFGQDPDGGFPDSGVAIFAVDVELVETERIAARTIGGQVSWVEWETDDLLLVTTFGRWNDDRSAPVLDDALRRVGLSDGSVSEPLLTSADRPFSLGEVRCVSTADMCLVTDAVREGGVVHRLSPGDSELEAIRVDRTTGLPPRHVGIY